MVMLAMYVVLANDPMVVAIVREPAASITARPITIASLPLRSLAAARAPIAQCKVEPVEAPRSWTPEKDVNAAPADACWGQVVTVTAAMPRMRSRLRQSTFSDGDNPRLRFVTAALPYLRAVGGGGALTMALTGRLALARGSRPEMRFDLGRGRVGATSYTTVPDPAGLTLGRPDRF